jgi:hypothetical protein
MFKNRAILKSIAALVDEAAKQTLAELRGGGRFTCNGFAVWARSTLLDEEGVEE